MAINRALTVGRRSQPAVGAIAMSTDSRQANQIGQLWEIVAVEGNTCRIVPVGGDPSEAVEVSAAFLQILSEEF
jgi:hypothetical protein